MTATNHVLTGALIAVVVPSPFAALLLAFASHFLLDSLPHFGMKQHTTKEFILVLSLDMVLASTILLAFLIARPLDWPIIFICGVLAASPDLMWFPDFINDLRRKHLKRFGIIKRFHGKIQWAETQSIRAVVIELMWFGSILTVLVSRLIRT